MIFKQPSKSRGATGKMSVTDYVWESLKFSVVVGKVLNFPILGASIKHKQTFYMIKAEKIFIS